MKIGTIEGRTGTYMSGEEGAQTEVRYRLLGCEEAVLHAEGKAWHVEYTHDSRSVTVLTLKCEGADMPHEEWTNYHHACEVQAHESKTKSAYARPDWVPAWMEYVEDGPNGICDILYMTLSHAVQGLCGEVGVPFEDDIESYSFNEDGTVEIWDESDEG